MGKKEENIDFVCVVCKRYVTLLRNGSYRNHCPFCLSSLHVDEAIPGDRKSSCKGVMKPHAIKYHGKKGWQIIHKCTKCNIEKINKIAIGDVQSDDWMKIVQLSSLVKKQ